MVKSKKRWPNHRPYHHRFLTHYCHSVLHHKHLNSLFHHYYRHHQHHLGQKLKKGKRVRPIRTNFVLLAGCRKPRFYIFKMDFENCCHERAETFQGQKRWGKLRWKRCFSEIWGPDQSWTVNSSCLLLLLTCHRNFWQLEQLQAERLVSWTCSSRRNGSQSRNGRVGNLLHIFSRLVTRRPVGIPDHVQDLFQPILGSVFVFVNDEDEVEESSLMMMVMMMVIVMMTMMVVMMVMITLLGQKKGIPWRVSQAQSP